MRFFTADYIFDGYKFLPGGSVVITEQDGRIIDVVNQLSHTDIVCLEGLLMPGLLNAHCHLELSYLKNKLPPREGLVNFLMHVNSLYTRKPSHEVIEACILDAETEMFENGIVAVGDIANTLDTFFCKKNKRLAYHTFVECFGLNEQKALQIFKRALELQDQFSALHPSSIVPHAPYSVSASLWELLSPHNTSVCSIHNQECAAENELFLTGTGDFIRLFSSLPVDVQIAATGKSSLVSYAHKLTNATQSILVHNTYTKEEDVIVVNQNNTILFWCLCPNANIYIENTLPDVDMLLAQNATIVVGTDSLASNSSLCIWSELATIHKHYKHIPVATLLQWATSNAAKALQLHDSLGTFEQGKKPGLIQVKDFTLNEIAKNKKSINRIL